ncbi:hypothetical protein Tco_0964165, partial [Tanacetum coccineum]
MDNTRAQQKALDDELVAPADRLKIGKSNLRLSSILKSKEPTLQVALDALKLTPFYNAFEISADVPEIYMQEFWVTVSRHHSSLRFKLNGKSHTVNVDNFRDMLKICPKLPGQIFEEPPLEEEILSFIRDLGHTGRSNLVYQVENKNSKKNNDMYYPRFTKVIVDYFMAKDQGIPRRNKMFWPYARDDFMFTTVRVISKHQDTQVYGAILPQHLTNQAMLESEAYMTYRAYATGKRITTLAKRDKPAKKKQSASKSKGLTVLSEVALTEAQQMKIVPDEQQQNISGTNKGVGDKPEVPDVPEYRSESEEESWTYSQEEDDEDNDEHDSENNNDDEDDDQENVSRETESDNDGDDFVHPNLSTYKADDQEEEKEEEKTNDDEDISSDQMVSTPPDYEITEEEENQEDETNDDEDISSDQMVSTPPDYEITEEEENQEDDDDVMGGEQEDEEDEDLVQQQSSRVSSDLVSKFINPSPNTGIDLILNPNVQSDIPVNVSVFATTETPSSDTTIHQPPIKIIQPQQQTHDSTTTTTLQEIPNFASLFSFERRVSSLETKLSKLKQTNQFAKALSSIPGIVDNYLASKMKDAVNVAIKLKYNKLIKEAQAENDEFLKRIDSN